MRLGGDEGKGSLGFKRAGSGFAVSASVGVGQSSGLNRRITGGSGRQTGRRTGTTTTPSSSIDVHCGRAAASCSGFTVGSWLTPVSCPTSSPGALDIAARRPGNGISWTPAPCPIASSELVYRLRCRFVGLRSTDASEASASASLSLLVACCWAVSNCA